MPYPNEHAAPQREASSKQAKIRRYSPETWPEGVHGVWEIDARNNLRLLSVRFKAALWTPEAARAWLEEHEMATEGFEPATGGPDALAEPEGFVPPAEVRAAAKRGLELRQEHGRGGTEVGVARARDLSGGRALSLETIGRMVSYFARHGAQRPADDGPDTAWRIAWLLWGGDPGREWANRVWKEHQMSEPLLLAEGVDRAPVAPVPEGLTLGRSFATLAVGKVRSRLSGDTIVEVTLEDLYELARVFGERYAHDPVPLDWNHMSSPSSPDHGDPHRGGALGRVVGAFVEGDRLYVTPAYTPKGLEVLEQYRGVLSSSPEFVLGDVYDRGADGEVLIGRGQILGVALTCRPAQVQSKIDPVTLTEAATAAGHHKEVLMKDEEGKGECPRCGAMLAELEALREKCGTYEKKMAEAEVKASEGAQKASLAEKLGGEVKTLAEQVKALEARAEKAEAARAQAENEAEAQAYLADGRIAPADKGAFLAALNEKRAGRAMWWEHDFAKRQAGHSIALGERGHAAPVKAAADNDSAEADKRIRSVAAEKFQGDYKAAYQHLCETDPEVRRLLGMKGN